MKRNLEEELRLALRRREPPPGFAERVLARAQKQLSWRERLARWWPGPRALAVAMAGILLLLAVGGLEYRRKQQGERAKENLVLALRIAGSKLHRVQSKVGERSAAPRGTP